MIDIKNICTIDNLYALIEWPFVQELMDNEWFRNECYLHQAFEDQPHLDSAYFVPLSRLQQLKQPE